MSRRFRRCDGCGERKRYAFLTPTEGGLLICTGCRRRHAARIVRNQDVAEYARRQK